MATILEPQQRPHRLFAIIPAAGQSRRMGRPKLLLPVGCQTVIARLLEALHQPEIAVRAVVVRKDDTELQQVVRDIGGEIVTTTPDPADMRSSLEAGIDWITQRWQPADEEGCVMCPADYPRIRATTIQQLIHTWQVQDPLLLQPTCDGRKGHPLFVRWRLARELKLLPEGLGMNQIVRNYARQTAVCPVADRGVLQDLDSPDDYAQLRAIENEHFRERQ